MFKYRASDRRRPKEDFFTEALAGVLNTSLPLRIAFAPWLIDGEVEFAHVDTVDTQRNFHDSSGSGRFDMWLKAKDNAGKEHLIVVENKIDAGEGECQLRRYKSYLKNWEKRELAGSRTLVYLTLHNPNDSQQFNDEPLVDFKDRRWFQVYDWLKKWTQEHDRSPDRHPAPLVNELLALMENWNMDMNLSANDLTAATTFKQTAQPRLIEILNEVKSKFPGEVKFRIGGSGKNWGHHENTLYYTSPYINERDIYFAFGFDFYREDSAWSVSRLGFPSAYFAVRVDDAGHVDCSGLPEDWDVPPNPDYLNPERSRRSEDRVKRLNLIEAGGASLRSVYLEFFLKALDEVQKAMKRCGLD